jgi:hypothetical protein
MITPHPLLRSIVALLACASWLAAADTGEQGELARYQEAVASVENVSRTWTYNGRTYRIASKDDAYEAARAAVKPWSAPAGTVLPQRRDPNEHPAALPPAAATGLGVFGILVVLAAVAGTVFVAVSVVTRRRNLEPEGPVLMTATGLVVNIDDNNRVGTGLITLNKRERRGHSAEIKVRTTEARRAAKSTDALLEAVAEAEAAVGPDVTPVDEIQTLEDPFEVPEATPVDTVSDRIRQKHQSSTRRQTRTHHG